MNLVYIVQYACTRATGKRHANRVHFVSLLYCKEGTWNEGYDTNYLYKLLTVFKSSPPGCLWFSANCGEDSKHHWHHLTC